MKWLDKKSYNLQFLPTMKFKEQKKKTEQNRIQKSSLVE